MNCCTHNCRQGRDCVRYDFDSAVLGARFTDGGHEVNGEDSVPLRLDPPVTTPDEAGVWAGFAQIALVAAAVACLVVAAVRLLTF